VTFTFTFVPSTFSPHRQKGFQQKFGNWDSDLLRVGPFGVQTPVTTTDFLFFTPIQTDPGAHPTSRTMDMGVLSSEGSGWVVALTTHPHLALRLTSPHPVCLHGMLPGQLYTVMNVQTITDFMLYATCYTFYDDTF
jgi:hypothetical protein